MGRKRKHDKHLPRRMYLRRGSYYLVEISGRWINLGQDFALAMAKYGELVGHSLHCHTLNDVVNRYRIDVLPTKAEKTQKEQHRHLDRLSKVFGHMRPEEITPQHVYGYMDARSKTPTAARHEVSLLGHLFRKMIRWGVAKENPVQFVEKPRIEPRDRYVTNEEFLAVYNLASSRIQIAMDLGLLTALRLSDLLSLTYDKLIDDGILVNTSKTNKPLIIEYSAELVKVIERAKKLPPELPRKFIIQTRLGKQYTRSGFSTNWQRVMRKAVDAGIEHFTFHDLRAKSASDTADIHEASSRIGHSSISITQRVYKRAPQRVKPLK